MVQIYNQDLPERMIEFLKLPNGVVKNLLYRDSVSSHIAIKESLVSDGKDIYYSNTSYRISRNNNNAYYLKKVEKHGFSFKNGKTRIWFGENIAKLNNLHFILNKLGYDWLNVKLMPYLTATILNHILKGNITNNRMLMAKYFKLIKFGPINTKLFMRLLVDESSSVLFPHKMDLLKYMNCSTDPNKVLEFFDRLNTIESIDGYSHASRIKNLISDIVDQAWILNKKVNFGWSNKRMNEEHKLWTREIINTQAIEMEDEIVDYPSLIELPKNFRLLDTKKKVFIEGSGMDHCLYTNYWNRIRERRYMAYHLNYNGEDITLELNILQLHPFAVSLNQSFGSHNRTISKEALEYIKEAFQVALNSVSWTQAQEQTARDNFFAEQRGINVHQEFERQLEVVYPGERALRAAAEDCAF